MRASKTLAVAVLTLGSLIGASQASAQGIYIGGSFGESRFDDNNAVPGLITSGSFDGNDTGWKIFGGYQVNPNFGLELGWIDLGKASYSGSFFGVPVTGGSVKTSGLNFSAVGTLPLGPGFSIFGKIGMFSWETEANDVTGGLPFSATNDGSDVSYGFGGTYDLSKNLGIRVEWERLKAAGDNDLYSLGIVYKF